MASLNVVKANWNPSIARLVEDFLMSCRAKNLSPATTNSSYGFPLKEVFLPWCERTGIETLDQLDSRSVNSFTADLIEHGGKRGKLTRHTIHSYIRPVRTFLNWCEKEGERVTARPSLPRLPRQTIETLSRDEIDAMERAATNARDKLIIRLLGDCGLRAAELCGLELGDLVRRSNQTYLHVVGKGSRERFVPVMPDLHRRLERYAHSRPGNSYSERIFLSLTTRGAGELEPLTPEGVCDVVKKSAERAGINRRVYTHLMRHSFFTNALRSDMNPIVLAQIGGHANLKMIQTVYSHLDNSDAFAAMSRFMLRDRERL